jgi:hypothetical protein
MIGGDSAADILSLIEGGYEILDCSFTFQQQTDHKGKATTRVFGGSIDILLSQLPPQNIIEWGMNSRKYNDGAIIMVDDENIPIRKIFFKNAACTHFEINHLQTGTGYSATRLLIQAETLIVGSGIEFKNEWTFD